MFCFHNIYMSLIYDIGKGLADSIPQIAAKIGSVLVFFFACGMVLGYWAGGIALSPIIFLGLLLVMAIMWDNLDVGALLFVLFVVLIVFFPGLLTI